MNRPPSRPMPRPLSPPPRFTHREALALARKLTRAETHGTGAPLSADEVRLVLRYGDLGRALRQLVQAALDAQAEAIAEREAAPRRGGRLIGDAG